MSKARDIASATLVPPAVSATELGYVDGVTSAIQTQINSKLDTATAASTYAPASTAVTLTGAQTVTNKTVSNPVIIAPEERMTVSATAATGTINFDIVTQGVLYYTTNASADWTLNVRGSSGVTLNTALAVGDAVTVSFLATNGSTAYKHSALTIDGSAQTVKWSGGTAPAAGNASAIDAYSFTIIKTGSATYTVLGAGPIKYAQEI